MCVTPLAFLMKDIQLPENKSWTLAEVVEVVQQTLDAVGKEAAQNELRYSPEDVYWLLHDMLRYVNRNVPGEYALRRLANGTYRVTYSAEATSRKQARRKLKADVRKTANYLEELTGRRPPWG